MSSASPPLLSIWTGGVHAKGGYGGWAYVRIHGDEAQGTAGGMRGATETRAALAAVSEALASVADQPATPLRLHVRSPELAAVGAALAPYRAAGWRTPKGEPLEAEDLWEAVAAAVAARQAPVAFAVEAGDEAAAFVQAWAAFALDIGKTKGTFSAVIPKPNLRTLMAKRG